MKAPASRAVGAWLVTRTVLAVVVLTFAFNVYLAPGDLEPRFTPLSLASLVAAAIVTSFAVAALQQRTGDGVRSAYLLLVADVATVTAGVALTGGAASVLAVLYGAVIVAASIAIGSRVTFGAGVLALVAYVGVGVAMSTGVLPHPPDQPDAQYLLQPTDLAFSSLSNVIGIGLVTLLAYFLAAQREAAGGALLESEVERRKLLSLNDSIVQSIATGLVTADANGAITSMNQAARALLGHGATAEPSGRLADHFPDFAAGPDGRRTEATAVRCDGSTFPAGLSRTPLDDEPGNTLLAFQDLTSIKELEAKAVAAERLAALGKVVASLAHEIRNPLSAISGSVELVRESAATSAEDERLLRLVATEVERLGNLVEVMLDMTRRHVAVLAPVEIAGLARDIAHLVETGHGGARVNVRVSPAEGDLRVVADASMLRQILWNLLRNAVQSSAQPRPVALDVTVAPDKSFTIAVRDRGDGISADELSRIFEPFQTSRTRGVGLGLALVRQLVDAHHATIDATSVVGEGTEFVIRVPPLEAGTGTTSDVRSSDPATVGMEGSVARRA